MTDEPTTRLVTVVVVGSDGQLRGALPPRVVPLPYWQETRPVAELIEGSVVLRLLDGTPAPGSPFGGAVTYLVESDAHVDHIPLDATLVPDTSRTATLIPLDATLVPDPKRMPWAEIGGPTEALDWARSHITASGQPVQHRTWNLSTLWSIPTAGETEAGPAVWLKCVPWFFGHEAAVLQHLRDWAVPQLVAAGENRLLMHELPGVDGWDADPEQQLAAVDALVDIQLTTANSVDALVAQGVPDLRADRLVDELTAFVANHAPTSEELHRLIDGLPQRLQLVAELGIPDTLVHGDAHPGNCRIGDFKPIWFDWGDSFIGNPVFDYATLASLTPTARQRFMYRWTTQVNGSDPAAVWELLRPVAELRNAWVYQRFLDNIEPTERLYHCEDVPASIVAAELAVRRESR